MRGATRGGVVAVALVAWACQEPAAPAADPVPESVVAVGDLADALRSAGASVEVGDATAPSLFSVPGRLLLVDGVQVEVFTFPDAAAAEAEVPRFTGALVLWLAPARLYRHGPLLVLHVGGAGRTSRLLGRLLGAPVATVGVP